MWCLLIEINKIGILKNKFRKVITWKIIIKLKVIRINWRN